MNQAPRRLTLMFTEGFVKPPITSASMALGVSFSGDTVEPSATAACATGAPRHAAGGLRNSCDACPGGAQLMNRKRVSP